MLGGWRAVTGSAMSEARRAAGLGIAAGSVFALLAVVGGWLVAPRWFTTPLVYPNGIPFSHISVHLEWGRTAITALSWGVVGGGLGAWLAARSYEEPALPRPTSA
jgi:hypothetical protein